MGSFARRFNKSILAHQRAWSILAGLLIITGGVLLYRQLASAAFLGNNGNIAFGYSTNLGRLRGSRDTYSTTAPYGTFAAAFMPAAAPSASNIQFVVNKASPTRNERLMGYQLTNGRLYMAKCAASCAGTSDLTSNLWSWSPPTVTATNTTSRVFDIAYEQLSGMAMVVYAGNATGSLYYCRYDGTSWIPVSSCAPTAGTNEIPMTDGTTTLTGTPEWVRLIPRGEQYNNIRTNDILMAVQDSNKDILVMRWDGSAWVSGERKVLTTTGGNTVATTGTATVDPPAFDIGWETTSGMAMAVYANGTQLSYRTSTGSGWSASGTNVATAYATAAQWVRLASDPQSNRMSLITAFGSTSTVGSTATGTPYIWKTDNVTAGFTAYTTITMAQDAGQNISTAWEKAHSGTSQALFTSAQSTNTQTPYWSSWVPTTFTAWAQLATNSGDVIVSNEITPSPNSDIMGFFQSDRDGKLRARFYNGSAWGAIITSTNLTTTMSNTFAGRTSNQTYIQKPYQYSFTPYSAWSLNWRVYDDETTAGNPGVALAPEGITPQVTPLNVIRLRMSYAELSGNGQGDTRKKLQYSSGAGCPDSTSCVWTDVGQSSSTTSTWRYQTGGLADNAAVPAVTLSDSTAAGYVVSDGTASASGDQQNGGTVQEYDYVIQNYSGVISTTYYFRGYDYGPSISGGGMTNLNPIYREQIFDITGSEQTNCTANAIASVCTYPNVTVFTSAPQAPIIYAPLNGDTGVALAPVIQVRTSDQQGDYVQYVVEYCPTNSWPCASGGGSFDQTSSNTNWKEQDANSSAAYKTSSLTVESSSMGEYSVQPGVFAPSTTYYLRAKAIDPGGSNTYSSYSSTYGFTTGATDVLIQGGATINGGTLIQ